MGKNALVTALVVGLTVAHPVLGVMATKVYGVYSHGMAGVALYNAYSNWKSGELSTPQAAGEAAKTVAGEVTGGVSDTLASTMVNGLKQSGVIQQISRETNVEPGVVSDMMSGTISASASDGFADLTAYTVRKGAEI
jgi:hypothetical protein